MHPFAPSRSFRRGLVAAAVGVVLAAAPLAFSPAAASADDQIGLTGAPADTTGATDGRTRFSYEAAPGQQISDQYRVANTGTVAQDVTVFASDAYNDPDGNYGLLATSGDPQDVGRWVAFSDGATRVQLTLQPGEERSIPFTLTVPADAGPGDHAGGIGLSAVTTEGQVKVDRRIASRLYVRVPGELQPILQITGMSAQYHAELNPFAGSTTVSYTVTNPGNVALSATAVTGVRTWFGIPAGAYVHGEVSELLPGASRTLEVVVPGIGQWGYLNPHVALQPVADDPTFTPVAASQTQRDTVLFAVPWVILGAVVVVLVFLLWRRWARRRDDKRAAEWIAFTQEEARRAARDDELVAAGAPERTSS